MTNANYNEIVRNDPAMLSWWQGMSEEQRIEALAAVGERAGVDDAYRRHVELLQSDAAAEPICASDQASESQP
jgi:hypothetical protein